MKTLFLLGLLVLHLSLCAQDKIASYVPDNISNIHFYWKIDSAQAATTIQQLKDRLAAKKQQLVFAMNGGMFHPDFSPVGLYIENYRLIKSLNRASGGGNFGMKPNGVFYITKNNKAVICKTEDFKISKAIKYTTQSGPLLLIDGEFHPAFKQGSANLNIRNGVGILPDGKVLFAISKEPVNFYDFALFFKEKGCKNALYLDGAISEMYCPGINMFQQQGMFGVIIGVLK
jgi:uncharacterized protein YigE (DUF2233 family)